MSRKEKNSIQLIPVRKILGKKTGPANWFSYSFLNQAVVVRWKTVTGPNICDMSGPVMWDV